MFLDAVQKYPKALEEREKLKKELEADELEFESNSAHRRKFDEIEDDEEDETEDLDQDYTGGQDLDEDEEDLEDDEDDWDNDYNPHY